MGYKHIVRQYVESNDPVEMEMLTTLTNEFVHKVNEKHPDMVEDYLHKLKMYLHPLKDKECAESVVGMFKNKDGSSGAHWDYDTTSKVLEAKGYDFEKPTFYYVLNMIYSDYYNDDFSDPIYIELAKDFLSDPDTPKGTEKAEKYIRAMMF